MRFETWKDAGYSRENGGTNAEEGKLQGAGPGIAATRNLDPPGCPMIREPRFSSSIYRISSGAFLLLQSAGKPIH
jgi:hypothetical protein